MADWWGSRRLGLLFQADLATVPAFAPIGADASWYRRHLGEPAADPFDHPSPLVEVLAHHRERWAHVGETQEFLPLLTFDRFDADHWTELARDAGASYSVLTAKHHDGLCWWDAPATTRTVVHDGPRRDVLAEFEAACRRADLTFGAAYSRLDWSSPDLGSTVVERQLLDLVERHGARGLWASGSPIDGSGADTGAITDAIARLRAEHPEVWIAGCWGPVEPDITTFEHLPPGRPIDRPWVLVRTIGRGDGYNRVERREHHLDGRAIVSLFSEVAAKGGSLLLTVCPSADGLVPALQADPVRTAGGWIRAHAALLAEARQWQVWGDDSARYLEVPARAYELIDRRDVTVVAAIDTAGNGEFAALRAPMADVREVEAFDGAAIDWQHDAHGLRIRRLDRAPSGLAAVYRVVTQPVAVHALALFASTEPTAVDIGASLAAARPGDVIQLGDGLYRGPIRVPPGVTVHGAGPERSRMQAPADAPALILERGARVEHLTVERAAPAAQPQGVGVLIEDDGVLLGCHVDGQVLVQGDGVKIRACQVQGIVAVGISRLTVSRSRLIGHHTDTGLQVTGGFGHLVESCEFEGHRCAIFLADTLEATVRGNRIEARWWGIRLVGTDASHVVANSVAHTMRAVDIDGGSFALVDGNAVSDGDSGCIVQRGASGAVVSGNHWDHCRTGLMAWDASDVTHRDNITVDLHEPDRAEFIGP